MIRFDTDTIATALLTAPGWARVGITVPSEDLRRDAAIELARAVATSLMTREDTGDVMTDESGQLALEL